MGVYKDLTNKITNIETTNFNPTKYNYYSLTNILGSKVDVTYRDGTKEEKILDICEMNNLPISEVERRNPYLLHAKAGAVLAKEKYSIENEDILNAIYYHTTGRPGMSQLEKIIFIADYMEPGRKNAPNLAYIRKMAFDDLDKTLCKILWDTLAYLKESGGEIDPSTEITWNYYSGCCTEKE